MWSDDDRDWATALLDVEADQCGGCGQPLSESTSAENEYQYTATSTRCHACAEMARKSRALRSSVADTARSESFSDGLTFHVHHD